MKPESTSELDEIKRIGDQLDRAEWDFGRCPDEKVPFCCNYEYGREMPEIVERFKKAKADEPGQFTSTGNWHHIICNDTRNRQGLETIEVIDAPPGFPDTPYLKTEHQITEESHFPFLEGKESLRPVMVTATGHYVAVDPRYPDVLPAEEVSLFNISWYASDYTLLQLFARWLKENRGKRAWVDRRGANPITRYHADLKALAAWRLTRHFDSATLAREYTAALGLGGGRGLYANLGEWSEAGNRVQAIRDQWLG